MAAQFVFVVGVDKTSNQVGVLIVTISSNSNCVDALDCLLGGGCTSALLVLGGVHVDADGGCGLVCGAGQSLHSKCMCSPITAPSSAHIINTPTQMHKLVPT